MSDGSFGKRLRDSEKRLQDLMDREFSSILAFNIELSRGPRSRGTLDRPHHCQERRLQRFVGYRRWFHI